VSNKLRLGTSQIESQVFIGRPIFGFNRLLWLPPMLINLIRGRRLIQRDIGIGNRYLAVIYHISVNNIPLG
jgi:hypothetical protein